MFNNKVRELILDNDYEDVLIFENPSYDDAFIGITDDNRAAYDYDKMVEWLVREEDMTYEEAIEFIDYNASYCSGGNYPVIIFSLN